MNYVANDPGRWIVYDADSIMHLDNDSNTDDNVDTSRFQIMEVIDSMGIDGENQPIQLSPATGEPATHCPGHSSPAGRPRSLQPAIKGWRKTYVT